MRDHTELLAPLHEELRTAGVDPDLVCEVELAFLVITDILPDLPAIDGWPLFSGYPFTRARGYLLTNAQQHRLQVARHCVHVLRRRRTWLHAIEDYVAVSDRVRAFELRAPSDSPVRAHHWPARNRLRVLTDILDEVPPYERRSMPIAQPGPHRFPADKLMHTVALPALPLPEPRGHDLDLLPPLNGAPIRVTLDELGKTAVWMDQQLGNGTDQWQRRFSRVTELLMVDRTAQKLVGSKRLTVDGVLHLVGMVGAGKSTLRDVLTAWLARRRRRVTVVVGDVAEVLSVVEQFVKLGLRAAPVLGASTREQHVQRLHRKLATAGSNNLLLHDDFGFDYLTTPCALNGFIAHETNDPVPFKEAPCENLRPASMVRDRQRPGETRERLGARHRCPMWSLCPRHRGTRELVDADIWVATPASLVHSAAPLHQNEERLRYLELACRRSDLVIVDEVDRVQMQLDTMFAPAATLVSRGGQSWLDDVDTHKISELGKTGRIQLSDSDVESWTAAVETVTAATNRLYAMLVQEPVLRKWVRTDYFSAWHLQQKLIDEWFPKPDKNEPDAHSAGRAAATRLLDVFRDNPLGDLPTDVSAADALVRLTLELLHTGRRAVTRKKVRDTMCSTFSLDRTGMSRQRVEADTHRFEFTLLLAALHIKLDLMTTMWPRVEAALNLNSSSSLLYRSPPKDYDTFVPESPMGNVLGFQFYSDQPDHDGAQTGDLRFFRCNGVGRALLDALHRMPAVDRRAGPHVLFMSGTSWAGSSTRYHLRHQVGAVLTAPEEQTRAITEKSVFRFRPVRDSGRPLRLSGTDLDKRADVLERMVNLLADSDSGLSQLDEELRELERHRRRILLLVGSYADAEQVADQMAAMTRWNGKVLRLVSDDADVAYGWREPSMPQGTPQAPALRRGGAHDFPDTGAEILVAPVLALERGHNIVNPDGIAAIGAVYFLARPSPHPDDISLAVHALNDWVVRHVDGGEFDNKVFGAESLDQAGRQFRDSARKKWREMLNRETRWTRLKDDRESVTWDLLVMTWQVIGRLVRGGVHARVRFVDAAFAPNSTDEEASGDTPETSLLHSMCAVLEKATTTGAPVDREIAELLYGPMRTALAKALQPDPAEPEDLP